ncbi:hypothetical protein Tco_0389583 [Tanacetum coccineum]
MLIRLTNSCCVSGAFNNDAYPMDERNDAYPVEERNVYPVVKELLHSENWSIRRIETQYGVSGLLGVGSTNKIFQNFLELFWIRRIRLPGYGVLSSSGSVYWTSWVRRIELLQYGVLGFLDTDQSLVGGSPLIGLQLYSLLQQLGKAPPRSYRALKLSKNRKLLADIKTFKGSTCFSQGLKASVPLFSVSKPCSACSRVFTGDIYRDHDVSCAGNIGIKDRHNVVRDILVDICFRSGILAGKEVDIELGGGRDKPLRLANMLLSSWDRGLDVCVDLTASSPLTQTGLVDFVPGRVVMDVAHRKRVKYEAKCADIGYAFLPFSFSLLGELEKDVMALLKRIREFFVTQDIGARATIHIFNRISFAIAKGVGAQIVSRLPTNFL